MFSYIVTGVIFVYNDTIMIILCVFVVYGAYAFFREIFLLFSKKRCVVAAVRIKSDADIERTILAEQYISTYSFLDRAPVLLCEKDLSEDLKKYGYEVYIKQTEEK